MRDINEAARSLESRRLAKQPAFSTAISKPPMGGGLLSAEERALLRDFSPESMRAIEQVKKVFPGAKVTEVRTKEPTRPPTELELRHKAMAEELKRKCEIRGSLTAELNQLWPRVLKERRKQRRANHERRNVVRHEKTRDC